MSNELNIKIAELRGGEQSLAQGVHSLSTSAEHIKTPDYQHDLNAAYPLLLELFDASVAYDTLADVLAISWFTKVNGAYRMVIVKDKTPQALAAAICEAWLKWKGVE